MATSETRRSCVKCSTGKAIAACNGCRQMFCIHHFTEHREELSNLMDNVSQEHDLLWGNLFQGNFEHPFLHRIDAWEQESIKKNSNSSTNSTNKTSANVH